MTRLLRNLELGVKLNVVLLFVLSIFLVSIIFLLNRNTQRLTNQVGEERVIEEVNILENRLAEFEEKLLVDINFLTGSVLFFQAVGSRNEERVAEIVDATNVLLKLDDITVVDGDGKRLVDTGAEHDHIEEDKLLAVGLSGRETVALLVDETSGETRISIAAVAPVVNTNDNILGAIQMSRRIDSDFLETLTFRRDAVHLGLVYGDQIVARTHERAPSPPVPVDILANGIAIERGPLDQARTG